MTRRVHFILVGDRGVPSARERVWRYLPALERRGIACATHVAGRVAPGPIGRLGYWAGLARELARADAVLIHRVALSAPERAILRASGRPVVFDLDDAIWFAIDPAADGSPRRHPRYADLMATLRLARRLRVGNAELAAHARRFHADVRLAPTCIEPLPAPRAHAPGPVAIGWIGLSDNYRYLGPCLPALRRLVGEGVARVRFVADRPAPVEDLPVEFVPWRLEEERARVLSFDIGIMPLADTPWARGKCGYKLLLYAAHGVPAVASPVGVNREILEAGCGLPAATPDEWERALRALVRDARARETLGRRGWEYVARHYSPERGLAELLRDLRLP